MQKDKGLEWEKNWWGTCQNTYGEETKQFFYASKMGLKLHKSHQSPYNIAHWGVSVLDIGGGPVSLLLKVDRMGNKGMCITDGCDCTPPRLKVIDPIQFPAWVYKRYELAGIEYEIKGGEDITAPKRIGYNGDIWNEVWIYNVLQHVKDPKKVIANARRVGSMIRIFEWLDMKPTSTHPHTLQKVELDQWLGGEGKEEIIKTPWDGLAAHCYYGVFPT